MSKKISIMLMAATAAMFFFKPSLSFAQASEGRPSKKADANQIKTPNTAAELQTKEVKKPAEESEELEGKPLPIQSGAPRRLRQHGVGLGLGQTFLMGNYASHVNDKITLDALYSYAASYSFDLLINAHLSEHQDQSERMKVMGLASSIKARVVEYDNLSPYFLGGLGFYAPQARRNSANGTKWTDQKVTFGLNFGGGVDLRLNDHYVVGVMGQMHWPFRVEQNNQSDLKGYYFKLLITGMYLF
jgi:hypothetical protein